MQLRILRVLAFTGILIGAPEAALAARADNKPPGAFQNLTIQVAARAITLKFVAPGDDGASGTATGYDVFYLEGICPANPNPTTWTRAPRSATAKPVAGGNVDFFNVRAADAGNGLEAGTTYCIAARALDERPNYGPFTYVVATTSGVPGDWALGPRFALTPVKLNAFDLAFALPIPTGDPVMAWTISDFALSIKNSMEFASTSWRTVVPSSPIQRVDSFRIAPIPDGTGRVGAVFGGPSSGGQNAYGLAEGGQSGLQVQVVASGAAVTGGIDAGPDGGITYVQRDGLWNPVLSVERIVSKTASTKRTRLEIGERVGTQWQWIGVLEREGANQSDGFFNAVEPFTKPDGTLGFVAPHCGILVYAERDLSGWSFWDVGPGGTTSTNRYTRVSFTDSGAPVLARRSEYNGVLQINHPDLTAAPFTPPTSCAGAATQRPNAWESITGIAHADMTYVGVGAVAEVDGHIYLSAHAFHPNNRTVEQRLVYRCSGDASWNVVAIDRTNGAYAIGPAFDATNMVMYGYNWGSPMSLYKSYPGDYVLMAKQPNTYCP